jgi:hypothetical protein
MSGLPSHQTNRHYQGIGVRNKNIPMDADPGAWRPLRSEQRRSRPMLLRPVEFNVKKTEKRTSDNIKRRFMPRSYHVRPGERGEMPSLPRITTIKVTMHGISHDAYEVVESEDGLYVTIREVGNRERQVRLPRSVVPKLVNVLTEIKSLG